MWRENRTLFIRFGLIIEMMNAIEASTLKINIERRSVTDIDENVIEENQWHKYVIEYSVV